MTGCVEKHHARKGRLGTLLRQEGVDPRVEAIFYRVVLQAILLYGLDMWVPLAAMEKKVEGAHTGFLIPIMGERVRQVGYRTWDTPRVEVVQEAAGTQS